MSDKDLWQRVRALEKTVEGQRETIRGQQDAINELGGLMVETVNQHNALVDQLDDKEMLKSKIITLH